MTIVLAGAYACLSAGVSSRKMIDLRSDALQSARAAVARIAADLRSAVPLSRDFDFLGMRREIEGLDADNVDFATRNYTPRGPREFDFCEVSYFVQKDPLTKTLTLFRRRDPTPDPEPLSGGSREEIARGLVGFRVEYYDGYEWYDDWGDPTGKKQAKTIPDPNMIGLPEAVRVTVTIDPDFERKRGEDENSKEAPVVLQTTARVNMSLFFYRSTGGSGGGTNNTSQGQSAAAGGPP